ncbi:MAG: DnaJ family domain-containing protein [Pseudomonadota bacterium]
MLIFELIAEQRIQEAIEAGEFDNLPGAGKPLALDDDCMVPEVLRVALRVLKNAGYVPPEVEQLKELRELTRYIEAAPEGEERRRAIAKLNLLSLRLSLSRGLGGSLRIDSQYYEKVIHRLAGHHGK